jgi:replicative DNA helicase
VGKTACASQIGGATAASGECVLYVALEPSRHDIMQSTIANRASVNLTKLTRAPKTLSQGDLDAVWGVANAISSWPFHVVDAHEREMPDTVARIENVMRSLPSPPSVISTRAILRPISRPAPPSAINCCG